MDRNKPGYMNFDDIADRLLRGKLNAYDVVYTKDTHEVVFIQADNSLLRMRARFHVYDSFAEAETAINTKTDTYIGEIIGVAEDDRIIMYSVEYKDNRFIPYVVGSDIEFKTVNEWSEYANVVSSRNRIYVYMDYRIVDTKWYPAIKIGNGATNIGNLPFITYPVLPSDVQRWNAAEPNVRSDWNEVDQYADSYILNKPSLGTASAKNYTTTVVAGSGDLVTSDAVKSAIDSAVTSAYKPGGTKACAELVSSLLIADNEGRVYNVSDNGTTTNDFVEGAGKPINAGQDVAVIKTESNVYKFNIMGGFIDLSNYVQKSSTLGLIKNDGTIDSTEYVPTIPGKGLSTNDYTNEEKAKLSSIADGAEVNVQSDWNETDNTQDDYIKNKPENLVQDANYVHTDNNYTSTEKNKLNTIAEGAEVNVQSDWNQSDNTKDDFIKNKPQNLVQDANYVHTDYNYDSNAKSIVDGVNAALNQKVDKITGKGLSTNDYTDDEKGKLNGIATGAEVNVQSDWNETNTTKDEYIKNKPTLGSAAAKNFVISVMEGSNDLVTSGAVQEAISTSEAKVYKPSGNKTCAELVSSLLVLANLGNVYNITDDGVTTDDFVEGAGKPIRAGYNVAIVEISGVYKFDILGGMVDLTNYIQKSNTSGFIKNDGSIDIKTYVETVTGKGLSTEDYTTAEKTKLSGISENANKVESSTTNGNIKIDNVETQVYNDVPIWKAQGDYGVKNLTKVPYYDSAQTDYHGVTWSYNADGSVNVSANNSDAVVYIRFAQRGQNTGIYLKNGKYKVSNAPNVSGVLLSVNRTRNGGANTLVTITDGEGEFTVAGDDFSNDGAYVGFFITISKNTTISEPITIYPMIRIADDTDSTFRPYAMTNKELTDKKVDKDGDKVLSTNDYTTEEKNKLAGIAAGANKVESSETNGNIKINGVETQVYDDSEIKRELTTDTTTVEGNPLNFTTLSAQKSKSTILSLEPIQDLHGFTKPWAGGAGRNLLSMTVDSIKSANTAGTWNGNVYSYRGIDTEILVDNDNNVLGFKLTGTASPSNSSLIYLGFDAEITNGAIFSSLGQGAGQDSYCYQVRQSENHSQVVTTIYDEETTLTRSYKVDINIRIASGYTISNALMVYPMVRATTDTDPTFEPYTNICGLSGRTTLGLLGYDNNLFSYLEFFDKYVTVGSSAVGRYTMQLKPNTKYVATTNTFGTYNSKSFAWAGDADDASPSSSTNGLRPDTPKVITTDSNGLLTVATYTETSSVVPLTKSDFEANTAWIKIEEGETATPYICSSNIAYDFNQTVYGGTLDVESGVLTIDTGYAEFDGSNDEDWSTGTSYSDSKIFRIMNWGANNNAKANGSVTCDKLINAPTSQNNNSVTIATNINIRMSFEDVASLTAYLALNPLQVCYELETPTTIQLTPHAIEILKGANYFSTDGDNITLTFRSGEFATLGDLEASKAETDVKIAESQILTDTETGKKYKLVVANGVLDIEEIIG